MPRSEELTQTGAYTGFNVAATIRHLFVKPPEKPFDASGLKLTKVERRYSSGVPLLSALLKGTLQASRKGHQRNLRAVFKVAAERLPLLGGEAIFQLAQLDATPQEIKEGLKPLTLEQRQEALDSALNQVLNYKNMPEVLKAKGTELITKWLSTIKDAGAIVTIEMLKEKLTKDFIPTKPLNQYAQDLEVTKINWLDQNGAKFESLIEAEALAVHVHEAMWLDRQKGIYRGINLTKDTAVQDYIQRLLVAANGNREDLVRVLEGEKNIKQLEGERNNPLQVLIDKKRPAPTR